MLGQSPRLFKVWSVLSTKEAERFPLGIRVLSNRCAVAGGVKDRADDCRDRLLWDPRAHALFESRFCFSLATGEK